METTRTVAQVKDDIRNLQEYVSWVDATLGTISEKNLDMRHDFTLDSLRWHVRNYPKWFGEGTTAEELFAGITQYREPALLERLLQGMRNEIPTATSERVKSRKIEFNDRGIGVFSFDRAAMGLYRLRELFSHIKGTNVEEADCIKEGGKWTLAEDGSEVLERWEQHADGRPRVRTSSKKVFAWFPRKEKERRAVEMYVICGGDSSKSADELLYSGIGAIVFAEMLQAAGIPTKVTIALGSGNKDMSTLRMVLVPVKNYDETLDSNLLATLTSDPRFFRNQGFKGILAVYEHFNAKCPQSFGSGINRTWLIQAIENSTYTATASLAPNRLYFGGTYSEEAALKQVNDNMELLGKKLNQ